MAPSDDPYRGLMIDSMRRDLMVAMKQKDAVAVGALRSAMAAIANAEAVPVDDAATAEGDAHVAGSRLGVAAADTARRELTTAHVAEVIEGEIAERVAAAQQYEELGRDDDARRLGAEVAVLRRYL